MFFRVDPTFSLLSPPSSSSSFKNITKKRNRSSSLRSAMEFRRRNLAVSLLLLSLQVLPSLCFFSPIDNHLVNCGSESFAAMDIRRFVSDQKKSAFCQFDQSEALSNDGVSSDSAHLYDTARVFNRPSMYEFEIAERGRHTVRLHFQTLNSPKFDPQNAQFHVLIGGLVALTNFTIGDTQTPVIKEYLVSIESEKLEIRFLPSDRSKFAFVNAIEVVSAPKDLVPTTVTLVNSEEVENFEILPSQAMEVVHRVNVGGPKVTPFNDTLWRTWITDDEFFQSISGSERIYFGGRIKYLTGGASREVGPDNVYKTARLIRSRNASIPAMNLTWEFPVAKGFKHIIRLHFCDIASISLELLFFNVYVDGNLAIEDLDLTKAANSYLASPFYQDFVVEPASSGVLRVSVGPSNLSMAYAIDAILNGVEIMKLNNSMGSLDGAHCSGFVLRHTPGLSGSTAPLVSLIAAVCVLLSLSIFVRRKIVTRRESSGAVWSRLPVDVKTGI